MDIDTRTYIALSVVMFFEYAIWGAWAPVLAPRLLGPLKMTGKQTGWIYATLPLACIFSPLIAGWIGDQYISNKYLLIAAHAFGAVLLFLAAKQTQFKPLLIIMLLYSLCFAATMPLVNAVLFAATDDIGTQGKVFIWAPVAWALVGWSLTGWRMSRKEQGDGSDCLYFASGLSVVMVLGCLLLTATPPAGAGFPIGEALGHLGEMNFLLFIIVAMVVAGLMQFYFLGSAQFMQDNGISSKHVPGAMALAQIAQAAATFFLLGLVLTAPEADASALRASLFLGFKWTLVLGAGCWALLYLLYVIGKPKALIIAAQPLHGLAYVFFIIVGQIFSEAVARPEIRTTMQALYFVATTGIGLFLGTQFAGIVMDKNKVAEKFQWSKIWAIPGAITLVGVLLLAAFFQESKEDDPAAKPDAPTATAEDQAVDPEAPSDGA